MNGLRVTQCRFDFAGFVAMGCGAALVLEGKLDVDHQELFSLLREGILVR